MITGSFLLLGDDGTGFTGTAPNAPTGFTASDAENCQITFTWTNSTIGDPVPTYELWESGGTSAVLTDITSPHVWIPTIETSTYLIKAINSEGEADSNTDIGTAVDGRPAAFTIAGTTDETGQITFTWTEEASCTYELFEGATSRATSITSPHVYTVTPDITDYHIVATNFCGTTTSNTVEAYSTETPIAGDTTTGGNYVWFNVLTPDIITLDRANWHIYVGGVEIFGGSAFKLVGDGWTLRIGILPLMYSGEVITATHDIQEGTIEAFTGMSVTNNSTLVADAPPVYLMTETLVTVSPYQYLLNSSDSGEVYNGRLEHSSRSNDEIEGTPWWPSNAQYPDDPPPARGWIDLDANGNATRQINTQWIAPSDSEWTMTGIYNLVPDVSYDMYVLHYDGLGAVDIYLGSSTVALPSVPTYEAVPYTPPTTAWVIHSHAPDIVNISGIIYEMDSFTTI